MIHSAISDKFILINCSIVYTSVSTLEIDQIYFFNIFFQNTVFLPGNTGLAEWIIDSYSCLAGIICQIR